MLRYITSSVMAGSGLPSSKFACPCCRWNRKLHDRRYTHAVDENTLDSRLYHHLLNLNYPRLAFEPMATELNSIYGFFSLRMGDWGPP